MRTASQIPTIPQKRIAWVVVAVIMALVMVLFLVMMMMVVVVIVINCGDDGNIDDDSAKHKVF